MYTTLLTLAASCALAQTLPTPVRETFNCSADGSRWPYLLQLPEGDPKAILIYLHGHYSNEEQGMTEGIYNDGFGRLRRECFRRGWAYVSTWYGGNTWMGPMGERGLADLIGILKARWPERPVYLGGGSMGGSSTLVFATVRPDLLNGVVALCPAGDIESYYAFVNTIKDGTLRNIADAIRIHYTADGHILADELHKRSAAQNAERLTMPVYLRHGGADDVIPPAGVQALAARLKELNHRVYYEEIPGGNHDSPIMDIDWQKVLDWLGGPG
jgi:pimeloyl-ACP methyl ester carboxylesterase